jgi:MSHA biogenesis protein MshL
MSLAGKYKIDHSQLPALRSLGMAFSLSLLLTACGAVLPPVNEEGRHLSLPESQSTPSQGSIPSVVGTTPLLSAPQAATEPELYTVVAQDVPIRDLLFSMARDAEINVDVHPGVSGLISINAINQTLPQILTRIARQVDIRWSLDEAGNMVVEPDSDFWRNYIVNYANVSRSAQTQASISTAIVSNISGAGGGGAAGGGTNNSVSTLTQQVNNNFWETLEANLLSLLQEGSMATTEAPPIVANAETGTISVRATARQHDEIAAFLNSVQTRSLYQVLIEATVVEVRLGDEFQQGVNWTTIAGGSGNVFFGQNLLGTNIPSDLPLTAPPGTPNNNVFNIVRVDRSDASDPIMATMKMLAEFGELRVLSSPKIMALNNQAAMLRVVNNEVYFTIDVQPGAIAQGVSQPPVYTSAVNTVPIGFVMSVTPQVGENDQVTLNVRPTISRIVGYVTDPNPILAQEGIINQIPTIQVREFESILKVSDGQIAILGGLMEDSLRNQTTGWPGLSRLPGLRNLFSYRSESLEKTELIIFIRPVIVRDASLTGDLSEYQRFLPSSGIQGTPTVTPGQLPGFFSE